MLYLLQFLRVLEENCFGADVPIWRILSLSFGFWGLEFLLQHQCCMYLWVVAVKSRSFSKKLGLEEFLSLLFTTTKALTIFVHRMVGCCFLAQIKQDQAKFIRKLGSIKQVILHVNWTHPPKKSQKGKKCIYHICLVFSKTEYKYWFNQCHLVFFFPFFLFGPLLLLYIHIIKLNFPFHTQ